MFKGKGEGGKQIKVDDVMKMPSVNKIYMYKCMLYETTVIFNF